MHKKEEVGIATEIILEAYNALKSYSKFKINELSQEIFSHYAKVLYSKSWYRKLPLVSRGLIQLRKGFYIAF